MENNFQLTPDMLSKATDIECRNCGCVFFKQVVQIKRISKILAGSTKDVIIPVPVFICNDCGTPLESNEPNHGG